MVPSSCFLAHIFSRKVWKGPGSWIVCFSSDKCAAQFFFYLLKIYDFPMGICQKGQPIFMFHLPLRICLLLLRINFHLHAFVQLLLDQLLLLYPPNIWPQCFPLDLWAVFFTWPKHNAYSWSKNGVRCLSGALFWRKSAPKLKGLASYC